MAAVMLVRNEAAVVDLSVRALLRDVADAVYVVDNGSSDGTPDILARLASAHPGVRWTSQPGEFHQAEMTTALAAEAAGDGATWVLPTDADEFWWTSAASVRRLLETSRAASVRASLRNFVQHRSVRLPSASVYGLMRWSVDPVGAWEQAPDLVISNAVPFIAAAYPYKFAWRAVEGLAIKKGNHGGTDEEEADTCTDLTILHAPLESYASLRSRVEHGRRVAVLEPDRYISWHNRRIADLGDPAQFEWEWRRNSVSRGRLAEQPACVRVVRDDRLHRAVVPLLSPVDRSLVFRQTMSRIVSERFSVGSPGVLRSR